MRKTSLDVKQIEDTATLKADMTTMKADIKGLREDFKAFVAKADEHYATKKEVADLKCEVTGNTRSIWKLSKEVATWGVYITILSKLAGLW
jgi:hypothetical protein